MKEEIKPLIAEIKEANLAREPSTIKIEEHILDRLPSLKEKFVVEKELALEPTTNVPKVKEDWSNKLWDVIMKAKGKEGS